MFRQFAAHQRKRTNSPSGLEAGEGESLPLMRAGVGSSESPLPFAFADYELRAPIPLDDFMSSRYTPGPEPEAGLGSAPEEFPRPLSRQRRTTYPMDHASTVPGTPNGHRRKASGAAEGRRRWSWSETPCASPAPDGYPPLQGLSSADEEAISDLEDLMMSPRVARDEAQRAKLERLERWPTPSPDQNDDEPRRGLRLGGRPFRNVFRRTTYIPLEQQELTRYVNTESDSQSTGGLSVVRVDRIEQSPESEAVSFSTTPWRWLQLLMFGVQIALNQLIWVTFAPISSVTAEVFDTSLGWVNSLSGAYTLLYLPSTILCCVAVDRWGMKGNFLLGALLTCASGWLRYWSVIGTRSFGMLLVGQSLGAIAHAPFTNTPVAFAAIWFGHSEHNTCLAIASMFIPLGMAIGQYTTPLFLTGGDNVQGMKNLLAVQAALVTANLLLAVFITREKPSLPPSRAAVDRLNRFRELKLLRRSSLASGSASSVHLFYVDCKEMLSKRHVQFRKLLIGFAIGAGMFNSLLTLIEQITARALFTDAQVGELGALLIASGLVSSIVVGGVMDHTRRYRLILRVGSLFVLLSVVLWIAGFGYDETGGSLALMKVAFAGLGATMLPMLPVSLENASECTFPISEEHSSALMLVGGETLSFAFILILQELLKYEAEFLDENSNFLRPSSIFMISMAVLSAGLFLMFDGEMLRTASASQNPYAEERQLDTEDERDDGEELNADGLPNDG